MSSLIVVITALILAASVLAADPISVDTSTCIVKSVIGDYTYDPTSGTGPEDWGTLKDDYKVCASGDSQSPIDFPTSVNYKPIDEGPMPKLKTSDFTFSSASVNWALTCAEEQTCGFTMFGGKKFYYLNTHFHHPSEHTLNGRQYPLESHMVHKSEDGDLAVLGIMYEYPDDDDYSSVVKAGNNMDYGVNSFMTRILDGVTKNKGTFKIQPNLVIKPDKGFCVYSGSLTTPPCSEGVTWLMALNVETVSKRQVHEYDVTAGAPFDGNNRPVQPLNDREITCYV